MRRNLDFVRGVVDLTSATLVWRMGTTDGGSTKLTLTESDGITISAPTTGAWSITIDPADTSSLGAGFYVHQGEATIGTAVYNFTSGRVRLRKDLPT